MAGFWESFRFYRSAGRLRRRSPACDNIAPGTTTWEEAMVERDRQCTMPPQPFRRHARRRLTGGLAVAAVAALGLVPAAAGAQANEPYPSKPIRFIVPYASGGPLDQAARVLAEQMRTALGPAGRRREQAGRGRQHRRRHGGQGRARTATRSSWARWPPMPSIRTCSRRCRTTPTRTSRRSRASPWSQRAGGDRRSGPSGRRSTRCRAHRLRQGQSRTSSTTARAATAAPVTLPASCSSRWPGSAWCTSPTRARRRPSWN